MSVVKIPWTCGFHDQIMERRRPGGIGFSRAPRAGCPGAGGPGGSGPGGGLRCARACVAIRDSRSAACSCHHQTRAENPPAIAMPRTVPTAPAESAPSTLAITAATDEMIIARRLRRDEPSARSPALAPTVTHVPVTDTVT